MAEWKGIFQLFQFSGALAQPHKIKAYANFENYIPKTSAPFNPSPGFSEFLAEWKVPPV